MQNQASYGALRHPVQTLLPNPKEHPWPQERSQSVCVWVLALCLAACGGPEEKKAKFYSRALELFDKGDVVKARLEVKNALQIDPKFAEGYELLGRIELKEGNFKGGFGAFSKAVELKPELSVAQLEMGKLFLMSNAPDQALEKAPA